MKTGAGHPAGSTLEPFWRRFIRFPRTQAGRRSGWLMLGAILFFILLQILIAFERREGVLFLVAGLALPFFALAAGILAAVAIFRQGERSMVSFAVLLLGLFVGILMVFELTIPH